MIKVLKSAATEENIPQKDSKTSGWLRRTSLFFVASRKLYLNVGGSTVSEELEEETGSFSAPNRKEFINFLTEISSLKLSVFYSNEDTTME